MQTPEQAQQQAQPEAAPEKDPGLDVVGTITIVQLRNGAISMDAKELSEAGEQPMHFRQQRIILEECLNFVRDSIMATFVGQYIDKMLQQQIKPDGFRKKSVFDFLTGK